MEPHLYLPLHRWLEAAGSLPPDTQITHPWRWLMNIVLLFMSLAWRLMAWTARLATGAPEAITLPDGLADTLESVALPIAPLVGLITVVTICWGLLRKKESPRDGLLHMAVSWVFVGLASLVAATDLPQRLVDFMESASNEVTEPFLEFAQDRLETLGSDSTEVDNVADPLGCGAYLAELESRSDSAPALERTVDTWMRWSYIPHWRNASYGRASEYQSERMYCRTLESRAGFSPSTQSELTVCAFDRHVDLSGAGDESCAGGAALLGLNPGERGPFRKRSLMSAADHQPQESAWVICRPPTSDNPNWQVSPLVADYMVELDDPMLQGSTTASTLGEINAEYNTCQQWFTGRTGTARQTQVCPPWGNDNQLCWRPFNAIAGNSEPATDVTPDPGFFQLKPSNLENWNTLAPPPTASAFTSSALDGREAWDSTRVWITTRDGGGAGIRELLGLFAGFLATYIGLAPIVFGLAGGVAVSEMVVRILMVSIPLILLSGASRRIRAKALRKVLVIAAGFVMAKILLLWIMSLYTMLFWLIGTAVPAANADEGSLDGLLIMAFTPVIATLIFTALATSAATKDMFGGVNIGSGKGLVKVGSGAATGAENVAPVEGAKRGLGFAKRQLSRARQLAPVRKITTIPSQLEGSASAAMRQRRRQRLERNIRERYSVKTRDRQAKYSIKTARRTAAHSTVEALRDTRAHKKDVGADAWKQEKAGRKPQRRKARSDWKEMKRDIKADKKDVKEGKKPAKDIIKEQSDKDRKAVRQGYAKDANAARKRLAAASDIEKVAREIKVLKAEPEDDLKDLKSGYKQQRHELLERKEAEMQKLEKEYLRDLEAARQAKTKGKQQFREDKTAASDPRKQQVKGAAATYREEKKKIAETREENLEKDRQKIEDAQSRQRGQMTKSQRAKRSKEIRELKDEIKQQQAKGAQDMEARKKIRELRKQLAKLRNQGR